MPSATRDLFEKRSLASGTPKNFLTAKKHSVRAKPFTECFLAVKGEGEEEFV
jgi:hypothetical protein